MTDHFLGYRRTDGRVGVRNVVAILSAMDNTNPSAERIGSMVNGTAVLATPFGRGQIGADFEVTRRTLAGIAGHPNTARTMGENIDVDVSAILTGGEDLDTAGERVWHRVVKVASGALTSCEVLNEQQLSVSRFGPSV